MISSQLPPEQCGKPKTCAIIFKKCLISGSQIKELQMKELKIVPTFLARILGDDVFRKILKWGSEAMKFYSVHINFSWIDQQQQFFSVSVTKIKLYKYNL